MDREISHVVAYTLVIIFAITLNATIPISKYLARKLNGVNYKKEREAENKMAKGAKGCTNSISGWSEWSEVIRKMGDEEIEKNNKLSPSKYSIDNIVGCARTIHEHTVLMKNCSDMAHQGLITFETAQKILNRTKPRITEMIGYLEAYLGINKEKGGE